MKHCIEPLAVLVDEPNDFAEVTPNEVQLFEFLGSSKAPAVMSVLFYMPQLRVPVQRMDHYPTLSAADGPENGTSTAKMVKNAGGVPKTGTPPTLSRKERQFLLYLQEYEKIIGNHSGALDCHRVQGTQI